MPFTTSRDHWTLRLRNVPCFCRVAYQLSAEEVHLYHLFQTEEGRHREGVDRRLHEEGVRLRREEDRRGRHVYALRV